MSDLLDDILPPQTVTVMLPLSDADRAMLEHLLGHTRRSPNGVHAYDATCHGCGKAIKVKRRPVVGKHNWCDTCTTSGEPAAQRARDYRDRKREKAG